MISSPLSSVPNPARREAFYVASIVFTAFTAPHDPCGGCDGLERHETPRQRMVTGTESRTIAAMSIAEPRPA